MESVVKIQMSGIKPRVCWGGLSKFGVTPGGGGKTPGGATGTIADMFVDGTRAGRTNEGNMARPTISIF